MKGKTIVRGLAFFMAAAGLQSDLYAELTLNPLFSDGAVLQQKQEVPIWGTTDTGKEVVVSFGGQSQTAEVGADGKWMARLEPMSASATSRKMSVSNGTDTITVEDVLVGEVWLCSGQSNMDFSMGSITKATKDPLYQPIVEGVKKTIAIDKDPLLRHFEVKKATSPFKEMDSAKVTEWISSSPDSNAKFSATAYYYGRELRRKLGVPVGLIKSAWGGTPVEPWLPMESYTTSEKLQSFYDENMQRVKDQLASGKAIESKASFKKRLAEWTKRKKEAARNKEKFREKKPVAPLKVHCMPSTIYNAMIAPLVPCAVKGVIWYQGESNAGSLEYRERFGAMIEGWRQVWGQEKLDFYWCQLAQYKNVLKKPAGDDDGWVNICYQQLQTLELPDTGMAVLNDIGQPRDIHPRNKKDAGKRLSLLAFKKTYGFDDVLCEGPMYKGHSVADGKMIISFDNVAGGLMSGKKVLQEPVVETDEPIGHFQIRGKDGVWHWAKGQIISETEVEVRDPKVTNPVEVRYAWASNAAGANLYNKAGLPASLFKTLAEKRED